MSGAWPVRSVALSCVKISAFGVNVSFTLHCCWLALKSSTRAVTQAFLAGSSGQLLTMVIWVGSARRWPRGRGTPPPMRRHRLAPDVSWSSPGGLLTPPIRTCAATLVNHTGRPAVKPPRASDAARLFLQQCPRIALRRGGGVTSDRPVKPMPSIGSAPGSGIDWALGTTMVTE